MAAKWRNPSPNTKNFQKYKITTGGARTRVHCSETLDIPKTCTKCNQPETNRQFIAVAMLPAGLQILYLAE